LLLTGIMMSTISKKISKDLNMAKTISLSAPRLLTSSSHNTRNMAVTKPLLLGSASNSSMERYFPAGREPACFDHMTSFCRRRSGVSPNGPSLTGCTASSKMLKLSQIFKSTWLMSRNILVTFVSVIRSMN
jgi:hypothetical protein